VKSRANAEKERGGERLEVKNNNETTEGTQKNKQMEPKKKIRALGGRRREEVGKKWGHHRAGKQIGENRL